MTSVISVQRKAIINHTKQDILDIFCSDKDVPITTDEPLPFVKWAGGKRCLIRELESNLPEEFNNYYEPFIGGGALFFAISKDLNSAFLSDFNFQLVLTYAAIKNDPEKLIAQLKTHAKQHSKDYYYKVRSYHNAKDPIFIAARLIYLNKTCYNGLYRVNKSGNFNVPIGRYTNPNIVQEANIRNCNRALQIATIECREFDTIQPEAGDFVYCDPPYHPTDEINFTSYTKNDFTEKDQERLRDFALKLHKKGVKVMLSNSNSKYINSLYDKKPFNIQVVEAPRFVNCKRDGRNPVEEVLITTY